MERTIYWRRFFKGLLIALRILFSYKLFTVVSVFRSSRWKEQYLKKLHKKNASLIRNKAIKMKGIMIKVGQFLSSRIDFLPDEYIEELSQLQDQVPPHDFYEIRQQVIHEFNRPPEDIFSEFDDSPIAAASLGQVHAAVLKDGRKVAVKIQYPDIEKIIETDIRMFEILIRIMRGRYGKIDMEVLHEEFSRIVRAELDYIREGKSAERFRENFKSDDRVVIPSVIWECTREKVLTLEFVGGVKITECDAVRASGIDSKETVNLLAEAYSKMIFIHGFFHGDPHPGNIFVLEGPRLVFVDFGMVQAIPDRIRNELRKFANYIVERNPSKIIDSMEKMGFIIEGADYSALIDVAQALIDKYRDISPTELKALTVNDISEEIDRVIDIIIYIQIPNNFILLGRTIGILNGIAFRLNPEINIIEIGKPYIKEFLRGSRAEQGKQLVMGIQEKAIKLWDLPSQLNEFLSKANRGEISFKLAKSEMEEITQQFKIMTNVMMLVILTVTTAASALFFIFLEQRTLSVIAAGTAVVLGLLSVFRLLRK
jgi:predicted unusual protein kinase regulating ubiquinone biosynthesis (AarF/ABC1/UbiB family)